MVLARPTDVALHQSSITCPKESLAIGGPQGPKGLRIQTESPLQTGFDQFSNRQNACFIRRQTNRKEMRTGWTGGAYLLPATIKHGQLSQGDRSRPPRQHTRTGNREIPHHRSGRGTNTGLNQLGIAGDLAGFEIQSLSVEAVVS